MACFKITKRIKDKTKQWTHKPKLKLIKYKSSLGSLDKKENETFNGNKNPLPKTLEGMKKK